MDDLGQLVLPAELRKMLDSKNVFLSVDPHAPNQSGSGRTESSSLGLPDQPVYVRIKQLGTACCMAFIRTMFPIGTKRTKKGLVWLSETFCIRMATVADAPALLAIYAPYVTDTGITFEYDAPRVEEFAQRMQGILSRYPYLIAEQDGKPLGYAYAAPFKERAAYDWAVETTVYLDRTLCGRGIGRQLYLVLEDLLRRQNILNANACIAYPNPGSILFHEALGYRQVAHFTLCGYKLGVWYDMIWMEKLLCDHPETPSPVLSIGQLSFSPVSFEPKSAASCLEHLPL